MPLDNLYMNAAIASRATLSCGRNVPSGHRLTHLDQRAHDTSS